MHFARRTFIPVLILLGLCVFFTNGPVRADRSPCEQIRAACRNAGFVQGGGARDGVALACFNPIVQGTQQPRAATIPLPKIKPEVVSACKAGNDSASPEAPPSAPLQPADDGQTI